MEIPKDLKGKHLVEILCRHWDYRVFHQQGSHIILDTESPRRQRISMLNHNPLQLGTLNSILRAVASHKDVSKTDIFNTL